MSVTGGSSALHLLLAYEIKCSCFAQAISEVYQDKAISLNIKQDKLSHLYNSLMEDHDKIIDLILLDKNAGYANPMLGVLNRLKCGLQKIWSKCTYIFDKAVDCSGDEYKYMLSTNIEAIDEYFVQLTKDFHKAKAMAAAIQNNHTDLN